MEISLFYRCSCLQMVYGVDKEVVMFSVNTSDNPGQAAASPLNFRGIDRFWPRHVWMTGIKFTHQLRIQLLKMLDSTQEHR